MDPLHGNSKEDTHKAPVKGQWIEFSISPPDPMQYHSEVHFANRLHWFKQFWSHRIKKHLNGYSDYIVYIEQSINGRLHLHGICKITDPNTVIDSLYKIRMGKSTKKDKFPEYVNMTVYRIRDRKHLLERYEYISKDDANFKDDTNIIAPNNGTIRAEGV